MSGNTSYFKYIVSLSQISASLMFAMNKFLNKDWNLQKSKLLVSAKMLCKKLLKCSVISPRKEIRSINSDCYILLFLVCSTCFGPIFFTCTKFFISQVNVWLEEVVIFMTLIYISVWPFKVSFSVIPYRFSLKLLQIMFS